MRVARGRLRSAGFATIGTAFAVVAATLAVLVGSGEDLGVVRFLSGDAWLRTDNGRIDLVDGASGQVKASVKDKFLADPDVEIIQRDGVTIAVNRRTGEMRIVDGDQLRRGGDIDGGAEFDIVTGAGRAYLVRRAEGEVQELDPRRLRYIGSPVDVSSNRLSPGVVDHDGAAAVVAQDGRALVQVETDELKSRVVLPGAAPDRTYEPSLVGDRLAVVDPVGGVLWWFDGSAFEGPVDLEEHKELTLPRRIDGPRFVAFSRSSGQVVVVERGRPPRGVDVGAVGDPGSLEVAGNTAVISDRATGQIVTVDLDARAGAATRQDVAVPGGDVELINKDRMVFVNVPATNRGAVVDEVGTIHPVVKFSLRTGTDPGDGGSDPPREPGDDGPEDLIGGRDPADPLFDGGGPTTTTPGGGTTTSSSTTAVPAGGGTVPGSVSAAAQPGRVDLSWSGGRGQIEVWATPTSGGAAVRVGTADAAAGATAVATGPSTPLAYGTPYRFHLAGGGARSTSSGAVTPYNVPGAPQNLRSDSSQSPQPDRVHVAWDLGAANGRSLEGHTVEARPVAGGNARQVSVAPTATSATITGLQADQDYDVTVAARSSAGVGPAAGPLRLRTFSSGPPPAPVVNSFSATSSAGLNVLIAADVANATACEVDAGFGRDPISCAGGGTVTVPFYGRPYDFRLFADGIDTGATDRTDTEWRPGGGGRNGQATAEFYAGSGNTQTGVFYLTATAVVQCRTPGANYTVNDPVQGPGSSSNVWYWIYAQESSGSYRAWFARALDLGIGPDTANLDVCDTMPGGWAPAPVGPGN